MALKDLTFTLQDEVYVSDPVQLPSDAELGGRLSGPEWTVPEKEEAP